VTGFDAAHSWTSLHQNARSPESGNMRCSQCGADNRETAKFCDSCGAALRPDAPAIVEKGAGRASLSGERRHLTVLFCDLVGSTRIATQLDPEEWREIVASYHRATAEAITRYSGNVAKYLGDGVMAYFGWPEAHENDGERAARASLAILENISKLNDGSAHPKLTARIGIDSGPVVVGVGAGKEADVFGDTPNIAARLQATAAPGTVLITAATHRLISGLFVVEALGPRILKGVTASPEVFRVVRPTGVRGRLRAARGLTPFVGREEELRLLLSRWERTREGEGQMALIIGEPGIGKSRLVTEFHDRIRDTPHIWMESAGEQFFENSPFHAIIEMLTEWLQLQSASAEEQFQGLERALASAGLKVADVAPLIADLLQLPAGERYSTSTLTAEEKRRRLLAALAEWVLGAARLQPLVMVVEDLHWLDPSTIELQQLLVEQGATVPLMLLYTARPEFRARWPMRTHHSQMVLNRLSSRNVREMIALVAARNALVSESVEAVVERTGGVPLFVEELTRAVLEGGSARVTGREIPATLHDSLMARLDRLGPAKEVVQIGAVLGSEFSYGLLHAVHPIPDEDLQRAIQSATDAELVYMRGIPPDATYQFKHALIRDTAYEALLRSRRKELHSTIADVLTKQFPDKATSAPELLAHHFTEAGLIPQAIPQWHRAGQRASQRSAHAEAVSHFNKGLELLKNLPVGPERNEQELALQIALAPSVMIISGHGSAEAEEVHMRARALCEQGAATPELFRVLSGLWTVYLVQGKLQIARELGEQLLALAQPLRNPLFLLAAHEALGTALLWLGSFTQARAHLEQGIALYDPSKRRVHGFRAVQDPGVDCISFSAMALCFLGYPEQGVKRIAEAVDLARQLAQPFSVAYALTHAALVHHMCRDVEAAKQWAEAAIAVISEHEFRNFAAIPMVVRGWALAELGQADDAVAQIRQGLDLWKRSRSGINWPHFLIVLAEALGRTGRAEAGLRELPEALAMVDRNAERWWEAEVYRVKAELTLQIQDHGSSAQVDKEAEACFLKAIEIAHQQNAKSWQLRATTRLARLLAKQGRRDEARNMLAEIYNWFTEGFDTTDLKEAKALLEELSD
jgi:class 3 adenylate cyclase/predicted ATPase